MLSSPCLQKLLVKISLDGLYQAVVVDFKDTHSFNRPQTTAFVLAHVHHDEVNVVVHRAHVVRQHH